MDRHNTQPDAELTAKLVLALTAGNEALFQTIQEKNPDVLSNALKHAFPEGRPGEISISLHREADSTLELLVSDNGIGIPPVKLQRSFGR